MREAYLSIDEIEIRLRELAGENPERVRLFELEEPTWDGRPVLGAKAGSSGLPVVIVSGGVHGGELVNSEVALEVLDFLCGADRDVGGWTCAAETIRGLGRSLEILIIPAVNPDGRSWSQEQGINWRRNRNPAGPVDLNRNFDAFWESGVGSAPVPQSPHYKGSSPFSEPETRNLRRLLEVEEVVGVVDLHSCGQTILYPWGIVSGPALSQEEISLMAGLGDAMSGAIERAGGPAYSTIPASRFGRNSGTFRDYAYQAIRRRRSTAFAFTVETGEKHQPSLPEADLLISYVAAGVVQLCLEVASLLEQPSLQLG